MKNHGLIKHRAAIFIATLLVPFIVFGNQDRFLNARLALIAEIEKDVIDTSIYLNKRALNPMVMDALRSVPRHEFVPMEMRPHAYANQPLPIGHGQTISQPYIVAIMTDLINPQPDHVVLEIGTGSGYQAAILAAIVKQVYSIEIIEALAKQAEQLFKTLSLDNIISRAGDGYYGWEQAAPFDAIVVTAAAGHIPPPLIKQLKPGGRLIIPVGSRFMVQQLVLVEKDIHNKVTTRQILPVKFVPLTGGH